MSENTVNIIKRDGRIEPYDPQKIKRVIVAAHLPEEKANTLIAVISQWVEKQKKESIPSLDIRDQVQIQLDKLHKPSADLYKWYQKTKDK